MKRELNYWIDKNFQKAIVNMLFNRLVIKIKDHEIKEGTVTWIENWQWKERVVA